MLARGSELPLRVCARVALARGDLGVDSIDTRCGASAVAGIPDAVRCDSERVPSSYRLIDSPHAVVRAFWRCRAIRVDQE